MKKSFDMRRINNGWQVCIRTKLCFLSLIPIKNAFMTLTTPLGSLGPMCWQTWLNESREAIWSILSRLPRNSMKSPSVIFTLFLAARPSSRMSDCSASYTCTLSDGWTRLERSTPMTQSANWKSSLEVFDTLMLR